MKGRHFRVWQQRATQLTIANPATPPMNPVQMSSPPIPRSSLPPSSAPQPSQSPNAQSSTRHATRHTTDALTFGDEANGTREDVTEASSRRRRRPRAEQLNGDVPIVKDAVGESVSEAFETFLKT